MSRGEVPWSPDRDELLRTMWDAGVSTSAIGVSLRCTKNSVIGRARRLKLAARLSPIRRLAEGDAPKPRKSRAKAAPAMQDRPPAMQDRPPAMQDRPPPKALPAPLPRDIRRGGCLWPLWDHRERATHLYCGEPIATGCAFPWCDTHRAKGTDTKAAA